MIRKSNRKNQPCFSSWQEQLKTQSKISIDILLEPLPSPIFVIFNFKITNCSLPYTLLNTTACILALPFFHAGASALTTLQIHPAFEFASCP
jgi:hypothetical protein